VFQVSDRCKVARHDPGFIASLSELVTKGLYFLHSVRLVVVRTEMVSVLVAVDGSQQGTDALLWVAKQIWKPDMQLDIVSGMTPTRCLHACVAVDLTTFHTLPT
jgi:hypothetical protein